MSAALQFHVAHVDTLFQIIGSADRDLLMDIGVTLGSEFRAAHEDEEEELFTEDEAEDEPEWDSDEEEADSAREIIVKMIMSEIVPDMSEDEAYAIQNFFASYAQRSDQVHAIEPDDLSNEMADEWDAETDQAVRDLLLEGIDDDSMGDFLDWLQAQDAPAELVTRIEMLVRGRLPEADEPTFTDLEDEAYAARFGYLYVHEIERVADDMAHWAEESAEEHGVIGQLLTALMRYCVSHSRDLVVTIDE